MKNMLLLLLLLVGGRAAHCQTNWLGVPENSATTGTKIGNAGVFLQRAQEAFTAGQLDQCRYYLAQSEKDGYVNDQFYLLLGKWHDAAKDYNGAERFWMRGYKKRGCWECKQNVEKMKSGQPLP